MTTFVWVGPVGRFGATTDLRTAANWSSTNALTPLPTASDSLVFSSRAGLLTGTAQGLSADFSGVGTWDLSGAQLTLAGLLTVDGALSTSGASVTAGSVAVNAGATLSGSGTVAGTITDNGTIMASGGLLTLSGTVGGIGLLQIGVGATLDVNSASAGETISFLDGTGTLVDHQVGSIGAAIAGFVAGDTIDLRSLTFAPGAAATIAGGVLTVTSGATSETLNLTGFSNGTIFSVAADASGIGTDITIGAAPPPPVSAPPAVASQPPSSTPPAAIAALDATTNQPLGVVGQAYTGPVIGLQNEYINITADKLNISVSTPNWFIHSGSGDDAIAVNSGTNVLDGGTGSNFLTGGSGTDTFFVDDRGPTADIWSTVVGFHAGDAATIWGVTPQDFSISWMDGQGATGFTGLTLHAAAAGRPTASLTLAGFSQADMGSGRLSVSFGSDPASGSAYMYVHGNS
jgi:RTX calcium-binding nonapeptide repeat (4 copies)